MIADYLVILFREKLIFVFQSLAHMAMADLMGCTIVEFRR